MTIVALILLALIVGPIALLAWAGLGEGGHRAAGTRYHVRQLHPPPAPPQDPGGPFR